MKHFVYLFGLTLIGLTICTQADDGAKKSKQKEVTMIASGTFDVKVTPQQQSGDTTGTFGYLFLDKQFHGDLKGISKGQMLGAQTATKGSGGYVALELVTGTLNGKQGSFILQHKGTMRKGDYVMQVTVVPDSGTEELAGIDGSMTILIEGNKHSYKFEYTFSEK